MRYTSPEILFNRTPVRDVMEAHRQHARAAVHHIEEEAFLNTPDADVLERILAQYQLYIPVLDIEGQHVDQREGAIEIFDRYDHYRGGDGRRTVTGTIVDLTIPFKGDRDFFFIQPETFSLSPPYAIVNSDNIVIRVTGTDLDAEKVKAKFASTRKSIEESIAYHHNTAVRFKAGLEDLITGTITERKKTLLAARSLVASLGYNLKPRPDAPKTYVAPLTPRRIEISRSRAGVKPFKPEPVLSEDQYQHILKIIEGMTTVMERSPKSFATMGEEDIRQHYLVQLNGQYEGSATGETFNAAGKTDILIRVEDRNIFIAECKFWRGEKTLTDALDQLLSYMTWRDTKAALVMFNRNKNFSAVIESARSRATSHPQFKRGPTQEGETRFRFVYAHPSDASREVIVTLMLFDIPGDSKNSPLQSGTMF